MTINLKNDLINGLSFGYFGYIGFDIGFWVSISKLCLLNFIYNKPSQFNVFGCPTSSQFHSAMYFKILPFGFCKKKKIKELRTWCVYNVPGDGEQCWILDQEHSFKEYTKNEKSISSTQPKIHNNSIPKTLSLSQYYNDTILELKNFPIKLNWGIILLCYNLNTNNCRLFDFQTWGFVFTTIK